MSVVLVRPRAQADLVEIWTYIADDNSAAADGFLALIDGKFHALAQQQNMGRARPELATNLRSFPVGRYVIFYCSVPNGIDVIRVLHGARDIQAVFQEEER